MFKVLQKVGKAFMLPIAILPAAGLLLGIGGALSNPTTIATYPILDNSIFQSIFQVMSSAGEVVFSNLSLLLCVGLCIGLAKRDKGTAALAGVTGYLVMTATIKALVKLFMAEGSAIDTGVIGALVVGIVAVYLHNRYNNIQLPSALGFFGGSRFVPIVTSFSSILIGFVFFVIWPPFQQLLVSTGGYISQAGPIGTFLYGFLMRLSGAVGLHHIIYPMFWYTELGGVETVAGQTVVGAQKIFFAQLADLAHSGLFTEGTRFFAGRFSTMMFGLPAACLAMYHSVPKNRRKKYAGLFFGVALTSFITGITEPIEFMFLFVSPVLYVVHAFLDGVSFFIADVLNISIGNTFSGGVIDFTLFGILQGNAKTNWVLQIPFGLIWSVGNKNVNEKFCRNLSIQGNSCRNILLQGTYTLNSNQGPDFTRTHVFNRLNKGTNHLFLSTNRGIGKKICRSSQTFQTSPNLWREDNNRRNNPISNNLID